MATVTLVPASPTATVDFVRVNVDAADQNDISNYSPSTYPTSPEIRYYLTFEESSVEKGRSYVFGVNEDGDHVFNNYVFPDPGTWVVHLRLVSDNSSVANSGSVTVQAP